MIVHRFAAIDPGKYVGVCIVDVHADSSFDVEMGIRVYDGDVKESKADFAIAMNDLVFRCDEIIIEDFILDHRTPYLRGSRVPAARVIGMIEGFARVHQRRITFVTNHVKNRIKPNVVRALMGTYPGNRHERDAAHIAAWYLIQELKNPQAIETMRMILSGDDD